MGVHQLPFKGHAEVFALKVDKKEALTNLTDSEYVEKLLDIVVVLDGGGQLLPSQRR